jgi:hypothetical protein
VRRYLIDRLDRDQLLDLAAAFDSVADALDRAEPKRPAARSRA